MNFEKLYVNGEWIDGDSGEFIEVENPATREIVAKVPRGNGKDVEKAVKAARSAFESWENTDIGVRISTLKKAIDLMKEKADYMVETVVKELGAGYAFSKETHIEAYIAEAENYLEIAKSYQFEKKLEKSIIRREAVGVIGCLTPWNFPLEQIVKKVFPAILAGNTVVLKPSQTTPLTAQLLTDSIDKAGLPKGVFNLVTGKGAEVGNALASHKNVDMVSFTGSTAGGREVAKFAIDGIKKIVLELGGKSPAIILKGADYDFAVRTTLDTVYLNSGQTCNAFTRLIVPRDEKEKIEEIIKEQSKDYKVGNPSDKSVDIGPLASRKQFDKVKHYIEVGLEEGARRIVGDDPKEPEKGYYINPTVFTDVNSDMVIAREEIFGPVLVVIAYDSVEEAIKIANDSEYGLDGAVFGPDEEANQLARKIKTGSIYINKGEWDMNAPFGGYKKSGIGREGGVEGFEEFMEIKSIYK